MFQRPYLKKLKEATYLINKDTNLNGRAPGVITP